jgi:hypothetical protein
MKTMMLIGKAEATMNAPTIGKKSSVKKQKINILISIVWQIQNQGPLMAQAKIQANHLVTKGEIILKGLKASK